MSVVDQREERRWLAEQTLSQQRDVIVGPLDSQLAQVLEEEVIRHTQSSSGHLNRRLELYLTKAEQMAKAVVDSFLEASKSPDDFSVDEIHTVALREIDTIRLKAFQDLSVLARTLGYQGILDTLGGRAERIKQGARRDIDVALNKWRLSEAKTLHAPRRVVVGDAVFVAMSFRRELTPVFEQAIEPAIEEAGRQIGRRLTAYRVDRAEPEETVTKAILDRIEGAPLIVGDLTLERPNCYYEVGYGRALGKRIVLTARKDHDPRATPRHEGAPRVHFDLDAFKITWWEDHTLAELREELVVRIAEVLRTKE